jgi:hypothetical protein
VRQPLYPLYGPDDPTLRSWQADVAELWDVRVVDLAGHMDRMKVADAAAAQHAGASPPYRQEGSPYAAHGSPPYAAPPSPHSSAWDGAPRAGPGLPPLPRAYDLPGGGAYAVHGSPASSSASSGERSALPPSLAALKLPGAADGYALPRTAGGEPPRWRSESVGQGAARAPHGMPWLADEMR